MVEVVEAADAPARWQVKLLRVGRLLALEDCLQTEAVVLVLLLHGVDVKGAQGGCGQEEVVLVLTEESNTVLTLANREACF